MMRNVVERSYRLNLSSVVDHLVPEGQKLQIHHTDQLIFGSFLCPEEEAKAYDEVGGCYSYSDVSYLAQENFFETIPNFFI